MWFMKRKILNKSKCIYETKIKEKVLQILSGATCHHSQWFVESL